MSAVAAGAGAPRPAVSTLRVYRDDGPIAQAVGRVAGRAVPLAGDLLVLAGVLPLVALVVSGADVSHAVAGAAIGVLVLAGGVSSGRPETGRLRWVVPPALRVAEYAGLLWLASLHGEDAVPAAFALLGAVAFRHYDLVYRLRHRGVSPPAWVGALGGGWDGRLVIAWVFLVTGALPAGLYVVAGVLGVVFVVESAAGWARYGREMRPAVYEDEEEEGE